MEKNSNLPFILDFDLVTGLCNSGKAQPTHRTVSNMLSQFQNTEAAKAMADRPIYDFYELNQIPETDGDLKFGTSIVYAGKVGDEYFMTKGHFHTLLETGEVYYCLSGEGAMLMETPEGDVDIQWLKPGVAVYVPPRWAHRSINTGSETLVTFFVFRSDAGHDYGTIEQKGYRKLVVERDGKPVMIDNPKWAE